MSNPNERGELGKRLYDELPMDIPAELAWDQVADTVLPPDNPKRKRRFIYWFLLLLLPLVLVGVYRTTPQAVTMATTPAPVLPAITGTPTATEPYVQYVNREQRRVMTPRAPASSSDTVRSRFAPDTITTVRMIQPVPVLEGALRPIPVPPLEFAPVVSASNSEGIPAVDRPNALAVTVGGLAWRSGGEAANLPVRNRPIPGLQAAIRYERRLGRRWLVTTGLSFRDYRFQTSFRQREEDIRLYRPGTIDTIYRNISDGTETFALTDTIGGTRIRNFQHTNRLLTLSVPLLVGRSWQSGVHRFTCAVGGRVGWQLTRSGRRVTEELIVSDLAGAAFAPRFQFSGRVEVGYEVEIAGNLSLVSRVGGETFRSDVIRSGGIRSRVGSLDGMVGIRWSW